MARCASFIGGTCRVAVVLGGITIVHSKVPSANFHWEARTSETEKAAMELAMCVEAVDKFARLWEISTDEDKQGMVRGLFSYIVFNLDTQRIVDFRLKPWADRFLMLRSALYEDEGNENADNHISSASQGVYKAVLHRGIRGTIRSNPRASGSRGCPRPRTNSYTPSAA